MPSGDQPDATALEAPDPPLDHHPLGLFNHSLDLLAIAGFDGTFRQVNPAWTRVLGWSREELLSRPIAELMHPDDRERTLAARERLKQGVPLLGLENRYRCKDGRYRWFSWRCTAVPGTGTVFAIARDITEQHEATQARLISSKLRSTTVLVGGIAHDFNNLIATLVLNLEMVRSLAGGQAEQLIYLKGAEDAAWAASTLVRQLMDLSSEESIVVEPIGFAEFLPAALGDALAGRPAQAQCRCAPDLWPARGHAGHLRQLIRHLVDNAVEAMPSGGRLWADAENVVLPAEEEASLPPGPYVRLRLRDEGVGIPPELLSNVFDAYFSTKPRGARRGMGLGLTFAHAIVRRHQGQIVVTSTVGRGTTVRIYLPAGPLPGTDSP